MGSLPPFLRAGLLRGGVKAADSAALVRAQGLLASVGGGQALLRGVASGRGVGAEPQAAGSLQASSVGLALLAAGRAGTALN